MQGGRPLCSEVGIVESESSVRAASSKPKSKHATGNRARSGSASSRCSTARSRSEEGSDNNDGGPRVSLREPCRPPAKAPSNPTPRSTISDDIMDTMRSYDPEVCISDLIDKKWLFVIEETELGQNAHTTVYFAKKYPFFYTKK